MKNLTSNLLVPVEMVKRRIYLIRGVKVMLDSDLADLYQVETKRLNEQVRRNMDRFPEDFMFRLNAKELENLSFQFGITSLRSQIATSNHGRGGRRYFPYAFTEQGVAMLSSVLNSKRAIAVNIAIMRAFMKLREIMATHKDPARKFEQMEDKQKKQQLGITVIFTVINKLLKASEKPKSKIGFRV